MSTHTTMTPPAAADRVRAHHATMVAELGRLAQAVAGQDDLETYAAARHNIVTWLREELLPHAAGEERTFYRAAGETTEGRALVAALVSEHRVIGGYVDQLEAAADPAVVAAWAEAILRLFTHHAGQENDLIMPILVAAPEVDLPRLLHEMHEG